jgi:uncharacterized protein YjiS (DUF1127 family)
MTVRTDTLFRPSLPATRRRSFLALLLDWMAVQRQRHRLAELPDHLLDDLGLTRDEARNEAAKPVWEAPDHWHR